MKRREERKSLLELLRWLPLPHLSPNYFLIFCKSSFCFKKKKCLFYFFSTLRWNKVARVVGIGWFPFPESGSDNTGNRLWLTSFPKGQVLFGRTKCSGIFQNGSLSPPSARSRRGFFSHIRCETQVEPLTVSCGVYFDWVPLQFVTQTCPRWSSSNPSITA